MPTGEICPNCGTPATMRFCPQCGQRQRGRLRMAALASEFAARFFSAERGMWPTLVELTLRPGRTSRNYIDGRRQRYVSPLFWYAICSGAHVLGVWVLSDHYSASLVDNLPDSYFDMLSEKGIESPREWAGDRYLMLLQSAYSWLGLLSSVPPMAITLRVLIGKRINLAEALVVSLHCIGHIMLITAVLAQVMLRISPTAYSLTSLVIYVIYAVLTVAGCFGWRWRSLLAGVLAIAAAGLCFIYTLGLLTRIVLTPGF